MSSQTQNLRDLYQRIHEIEEGLRDIRAQLTSGQQSYETTVIPADYSHKHMPSALLPGTLSSNIRFSGTITFAGLVNFADGSTYYVQADGDANFKDLTATTFGGIASANLLDKTAAESISGVYSFGAVDVNFANGTTYKIESDGDAFFKELTLAGNLNMQNFNILNPLEIRQAGNSRSFLQLYRTNASDVNPPPYINLGKEGADRLFLSASFDGANQLTELLIASLSSGGASAAGFGDIVLKPDNVEKLRLKADGGLEHIGVSQFGDGGTTHYAQFAADGELTLFGTARVKQEIVLSATAARVGATAPTAAFINNFAVFQFSNTPPAESIYFTFHVPKDWASGTDITLHIHWAPTDGNAGNVVWDIDYKLVADEANEVISGAGTNATVTDATQTLQDEMLESPNFTIAAAGIALEDTIGLKVTRDTGDAADTYGAAASLVIVEIEYTSDRLGEAT